MGADHLFHTFLSRYWNRREDEYGGSDLRNRARFSLEVIKAIKKKVGEDFPIQVLMNGFEFGVGDMGITVEEAVATAKMLEEAGVNSLPGQIALGRPALGFFSRRQHVLSGAVHTPRGVPGRT